MEFQTELGGGEEIAFLTLLSFIWCERERFFYYLTAFSFNKMINAYFKLAYAEPRPYMISS